MTTLRRRHDGERGNAMIIALMLTLVMGGLSGTYLLVAHTKQKMTFREMARENAFRIAEAGIAQGIFELNARRDYNMTTWTSSPYPSPTPLPASVGAVGSSGTQIVFNGGSYFTTSYTATDTGTALPAGQVRLVASGIFGGSTRVMEVIVDPPPPPATSSVPGLAAVTTLGPITVSGSMIVDGRDWDINGGAVVGPGTFGIVGGGTIPDSGSGSIGGNGIAPPGGGGGQPAGTTDDSHNWGADGFDNDGDGTIDEVGETYGSSPDQVFAQPANTMKNRAIAEGHFYNSFAAYEAALNAGEFDAGGDTIYVEASGVYVPANLPNAMNASPSILIFQAAPAQPEAQLKNVHGNFKGVLVAQNIDHVNAGTEILGACFTKGSLSNAFGNGNSRIRFSSAVLANLPNPGGNNSPFFTLRMWREKMRHF